MPSYPPSQPSTPGETEDTCNNHSPGVRVFINTPTQTPQISRSTICISIQFQQSSLVKHAYSLVLQYSLSTSVQ
ncbi:hypothetical protein O181_114292, partial [Austropuccinia psidii MF-1]|nr:hypothetical protein [Austropuccinia psidii MF-1]